MFADKQRREQEPAQDEEDLHADRAVDQAEQVREEHEADRDPAGCHGNVMGSTERNAKSAGSNRNARRT